MSKTKDILDRYPTDPTKKRPKIKSYAMIAAEFRVSRQFVWAVFHPAKPKPDIMLTPKQRGWARDKIKHGNGTEAAMENYDVKSRTTASQIAVKNMKHPIIRQYMIEILDRANLTDEFVAENLKTIIHEGANNESAEARDSIRGMELAMKLRDRFPSQKIEQTSQVINIDVNLSQPELLKKLSEVTEENNKFLGAIKGEIVK